MQTWKTLSRKTILHQSQFLTVEEHTIELPDGRQISDWSWIITLDYVNVLARTTGRKFLCFRQVKYGIEGTSFAPVGGHLEAGEDPYQAAQRELMEETGYRAEAWDYLGQYRVDANHGCGIAHMFFADRAVRVREPASDDLEEQHLHLLSLEEVKTALLAGQFKVLGWATVAALALLKLE